MSTTKAGKCAAIGAVPFILLELLVMALLIVFPAWALWLPSVIR